MHQANREGTMPPVGQPGYYVQGLNQPTIMVALETQQGNKQLFKPQNKHSIIVMGSMQLVVGLICIVLQGVATGLKRDTYTNDDFVTARMVPGVWTGLFFMLCGIIGLLSAHQNKSGLVVCFMILNILSALLAFVLFICSSVVAGINNEDYRYSSLFYNSRDSQKYMALGVLLLLLGLFEMIISIWCSALCCGAVCCSNSTSPSPVYYNVQGANTQIVYGQQLAGVAFQRSYAQQPLYSQQMGGFAVVAGPYGQPAVYSHSGQTGSGNQLPSYPSSSQNPLALPPPPVDEKPPPYYYQ